MFKKRDKFQIVKLKKKRKVFPVQTSAIADPLLLFGISFTMGSLPFLLISSRKTLNFLYTVFFISIRRPGGTQGKRK